MKTNKSFSKRIRVTKNGKMLVRKPGKNHFNARQSRSSILKRNGVESCHIDYRMVAHQMPGSSPKAPGFFKKEKIAEEVSI